MKMFNALRDAAGNFYINDKSTGSIVGQQPFGGARKVRIISILLFIPLSDGPSLVEHK